jgi:hypothetical protein
MESVPELTKVQGVQVPQVGGVRIVSPLTTPVLLLVVAVRLSVVLTSLPFRPPRAPMIPPADPLMILLRILLRTPVGFVALEAS